MERKSLKRLAILTALVAVVALALAAGIGALWGLPWVRGRLGARSAARQEQLIDERSSIALAGLERLLIQTTSEDVRVRLVGGPEVSLHLYGTYLSSDPAGAPRLAAGRKGAEGSGQVERQSPGTLGWQLSDLLLEVEVPQTFGGELTVRSVSGDIHVGDMRLGRIALASTSGDVQAGRLRAESLSVATVSGDVAVQAAEAVRTEFSATSGTVRIAGLTGMVRGETVSGDQHLVLAGAVQKISLQSTSGEVSVRLPTASAFDLEARSTSGEVVCRMPIRLDEYSSGGGRHTLVGTVGGGGELIEVRSVSGDITILE